jgi:hypothetical protein
VQAAAILQASDGWRAALIVDDGRGHRTRRIGEARFRTAAAARYHAEQWANAWRAGVDEFVAVERASNG